MSEMISIQASAELLGCSVMTIRRAIANGTVRAERVGNGRGRLWVSLDDVQAMRRPATIPASAVRSR